MKRIFNYFSKPKYNLIYLVFLMFSMYAIGAHKLVAGFVLLLVGIVIGTTCELIANGGIKYEKQ